MSAAPRADSRLTITTTIRNATGGVVHAFVSPDANDAITRMKKLVCGFDRKYPDLKPHTSKTIIQPNF